MCVSVCMHTCIRAHTHTHCLSLPDTHTHLMHTMLHVQVMTHANMLKEDREKVGITDGFVRVSCGIEDTNDLIKSLKIALDAL